MNFNIIAAFQDTISATEKWRQHGALTKITLSTGRQSVNSRKYVDSDPSHDIDSGTFSTLREYLPILRGATVNGEEVQTNLVKREHILRNLNKSPW